MVENFRGVRDGGCTRMVVSELHSYITMWCCTIAAPASELCVTGLLFLFAVLNQLPLPSPLPATTTKSLLFNGRIAEEVNCLLACRDENLVSQLAHSLNQVSTEHM